MSTTIWALAGGGLASVMFGWVTYISTIPRNTVPKQPVLMLITQALEAALAAAGMVMAFRHGGSHGGLFAMAGFACFMALFFFVLASQRKVPLGDIQVAVGKPLLPFEAKDDAGNLFHFNREALAGKRVLLKFFRGSW